MRGDKGCGSLCHGPDLESRQEPVYGALSGSASQGPGGQQWDSADTTNGPVVFFQRRRQQEQRAAKPRRLEARGARGQGEAISEESPKQASKSHENEVRSSDDDNVILDTYVCGSLKWDAL